MAEPLPAPPARRVDLALAQAELTLAMGRAKPAHLDPRPLPPQPPRPAPAPSGLTWRFVVLTLASAALLAYSLERM